MVHRSGYATAAALVGVATLHSAWGFGAAFPFASQDALADAVVGGPHVPPPLACHAVAAALVVAGGLAADLPVGSSGARKLGRAVVAVALGARGGLGLAGVTDFVSPGSTSPRFRKLDRRLYSPLCLLLSAGTATATMRC